MKIKRFPAGFIVPARPDHGINTAQTVPIGSTKSNTTATG